MTTLVELQDALRNADAAGDTDAAQQLADAIVSMQEQKPEGSFGEKMLNTYGSLAKGYAKSGANLLGGGLRGAGSIGATLILPFEGWDANMQRRKAMGDALGSLGVDTDSILYGAGKLGGEIAGTAGLGSGVSAATKMTQWAPRLAKALSSMGMTTGAAPVGTTAKVVDLGIRTAGGGASGLLQAGAVDPEHAKTGAVIGAVTPSVLKAAGASGGWLGNKAWEMLTPDIQRRAVQLSEMTGQKIDDLVAALTKQGPSLTPGVVNTVPQILQDRNISQVARTLKSSGQNALGEREVANSEALAAALERVAPTAGTINDARANLGGAVERFAKPLEAKASAKVNGLFESIPDNVRMHLPLNEMGAAQERFVGRGSFGKGLGAVQQAMKTAEGIGTETLGAVRAAPQSAGQTQNLEQAVRALGGIKPDAKVLTKEIAELGRKQSGTTGLISSNGVSAEDAAMLMHERGFLPNDDPAAMLEILRNGGGRKVLAADAVESAFQRQMEAAMGDVPGKEVVSKVVPFSEIQNLRSSIGEAATEAKQFGRNQAFAALTGMKKAIDEKVAQVASGNGQADEMFSPKAVSIWKQALAEHATKKARFNTGPQAAMFRMGQDGLPAKEGAEIAPLFWNSGNSQIESMKAFKRLTGNNQALVRLMKSNATTEVAQEAGKGPERLLAFDAFDKWLRNHSGAAKELFAPSELATLKAIRNELKTAVSANALGRAEGSNTAQNLFSMGALDSPRLQSLANNAPFGIRYITGPLLASMKGTNEKTRNELLSRLLTDPDAMAQALGQASARDATRAQLANLLANPQAGEMIRRSAPVISAQ